MWCEAIGLFYIYGVYTLENIHSIKTERALLIAFAIYTQLISHFVFVTLISIRLHCVFVGMFVYLLVCLFFVSFLD